MILPVPQDPSQLRLQQITWTIILANLFFFLLLFADSPSRRESFDFLSKSNLEVSGYTYRQFLEKLDAVSKLKRPAWYFQLDLQNPDQVQTLGQFAIRDQEFLHVAIDMNFAGDQVEIKKWKLELGTYLKKYESQKMSQYGLSSMTKGTWSWITYQFAHGGWIHLLSNMIFMMVIGSAVEVSVGALGLVLIYLFGGIAGAMIFLFFNAYGIIPMVGASASVSALMGFYALFERRKVIRYYFFLAPMSGSHGYIYLPTFLIIPLYLISDFASLLSSPQGLTTGVAYAAHIGGSVFGMSLAIVMRFLLKMKPLPNEILRES